MRWIVLLIAMLPSAAMADDLNFTPHSGDNMISGTGPNLISGTGPNLFSGTGPQYLSVSCGKGTATVNLDNGNVEFKDCAPNKAAREFWMAVKQMRGGECSK